MRLAVAHLVKYFAKGAFMARFAIHDHAVHIKDDGTEAIHFRGGYIQQNYLRTSDGALVERDVLAERRGIQQIKPMAAIAEMLEDQPELFPEVEEWARRNVAQWCAICDEFKEQTLRTMLCN